MLKRKIRFFMFTISGFFLCLDQFLKYQTILHPSFTAYLYKPWIGWEAYKNYGVAFGIPVPNFILLLITPPICLLITLFFIQTYQKSQTRISFSLLLIMAGTISNYIDRVLYGYTVDYFRLLTSILNIGDILITTGALILLLSNRTKKTNKA